MLIEMVFVLPQVLEEFESYMEVPKATVVANWERAVPKIIDYYIELKIPCVTYGTLGGFPFCYCICHH